MKKYFYLLFVAILLASCSSDSPFDDGGKAGNYTAEDIAGEWNISKSYPVELAANDKETEELIDKKMRNFVEETKYLFKSNGTFVYETDYPGEKYSGKFSVKGNILTLGFPKPNVIEIKLTKNTLIFYEDFTESYQNDLYGLFAGTGKSPEGIIISKAVRAMEFKRVK